MLLKTIKIQGYLTVIQLLTVTTLSAQALASSRAFPFGSLERTMENAAKRASDSSTAKSAKLDIFAEKCVDLSGDWVGTCSNPDSEPNDDSLSVRQTGCSTFEFEYPGNLFLPKMEVNKPTVFEFEDEYNAVKGVSILVWNDSQTKVFSVMSATISGFPTATFGSVILSQEIWISDDILYTREGPKSDIFTPFVVYPNVTPGSFCQYHRRGQ